MIREGVNGYLFPAGSDETVYVDTIKTVFADKNLYLTLRSKCRDEFEKRLSWTVWINEVNRLISATGDPEIVRTSKVEDYEEGY